MNSVPTSRRKLNQGQLAILYALYKFRFGTRELLANSLGVHYGNAIHSRLSILEKNGYIGRHYDSSYRLAGKAAAYFLTPLGARTLGALQGETEDAINFKLIYRNSIAKSAFIDNCLDIFDMYVRLKRQHINDIKYFTRINLNYARFDYFPNPLPEAYMRIRTSGNDSIQYFLEFCYITQPHFVPMQRIKKYIDYAEADTWKNTGTNLPHVLIVCESTSLLKRVQEYVDLVTNYTWHNTPTFIPIIKTELQQWIERDSKAPTKIY